MSNFDDVKTFMKTFGQEVKIKAEFPEEKIVKLRYNLIKEEFVRLGLSVSYDGIWFVKRKYD